MTKKILIVDDDRVICQSLKLLFHKAGYEVQCIYNPLNALAFIDTFKPSLVLLDMNFTIDTTGKQGLEILSAIKKEFPALDIILITGWGSVELAVQGMKMGANDFLTKPWDNEQLLQSVRTILTLQDPKENESQNIASLKAIIGESSAIKDVKKTIRQIAATEATVLITGESGTGKELVAEAIHDNSQRADDSFVKVNLGGVSTSLFESELFGHKKGAFTGAISDRIGRFQKAHKGTIFLDEIGDIDPASQVKLLRVLQEKTFEPLGSSKTVKVNVRIISATHKNLEDLVETGDFREDLYYRVNLLHIHLPSLRERRGDIPLLAKSFIDRLNKNKEGKPFYIDPETFEWLSRQEYSGNIRQLKNIVERTCLLSSTNKLSIKDFKPHFLVSSGRKSELPKIGTITLDELEKAMIQKAMSFHNGNISQVARSLGITRSALYRRLEKYNIGHET